MLNTPSVPAAAEQPVTPVEWAPLDVFLDAVETQASDIVAHVKQPWRDRIRAAIKDGTGEIRMALDLKPVPAWRFVVKLDGMADLNIAACEPGELCGPWGKKTLAAAAPLVQEMVSRLSDSAKFQLGVALSSGELFLKLRVNIGQTFRLALAAVRTNGDGELHLVAGTEATTGLLH